MNADKMNAMVNNGVEELEMLGGVNAFASSGYEYIHFCGCDDECYTDNASFGSYLDDSCDEYYHDDYDDEESEEEEYECSDEYDEESDDEEYCDKSSRKGKVDEAPLDLVKLYLKDISRVPLLTAEEEKALAHRIAQGDKEAETRFYEANLRLVVSIAKNYTSDQLALLDLIQEGNIGLIKAVRRYNPSKARFSTYATYWIKQAIGRAISRTNSALYISDNMHGLVGKIRRIRSELTQTLRREPTIEQIAEKLGETPQKIREIMIASQKSTSLDAPVGDETDSGVLGTFISDENDLGVDNIVMKSALARQLDKVLVQLTPREEYVIRHRFGLNGTKSYTLDALGRKMGVTRERVRQIEDKALLKLRRHDRRALLEAFRYQ